MDDDRWMGEALAEASKAFRKNEVPIGAVVVKDGLVVARGSGRRRTPRLSRSRRRRKGSATGASTAAPST